MEGEKEESTEGALLETYFFPLHSPPSFFNILLLLY